MRRPVVRTLTSQRINTRTGRVQGGGTQANVLANRPDPAADGVAPTGWFVTLSNPSTSLANVTAYAICAQAG